MIFDNLTLAAMGIFVLITVFLISTKNRPRCKEGQPLGTGTNKSSDR